MIYVKYIRKCFILILTLSDIIVANFTPKMCKILLNCVRFC